MPQLAFIAGQLGLKQAQAHQAELRQMMEEQKTNRVEAANLTHTGPLLTHAVVPFFATRVTCVETQTAFTTASHDDQGRSSRAQPNGCDDPFPV
jgi:hypothetical protein